MSPQAIRCGVGVRTKTGREAWAQDARRTCVKLCREAGGELEQIQLLWGHASVQTTERYLGTKQDLANAPNDGLGLKVEGGVSGRKTEHRRAL
jgi:integrase